jgi:hypothetical protein
MTKFIKKLYISNKSETKQKNLIQLEDYSLNSSNIKSILGSSIKIIEYSQLGGMKSIDEAFDNQGRCVLFFATTSNDVGHWECAYRIDTNIVFFDSYGLDVDQCKNFVSKKLEIKLHEYPDYLSDLLRKSRYSVYHNPIHYQQMKNDVSTCGKHSVFRLLNKELSAQQYLELMNNLKTKYNVNTYDLAISLYFKEKYNIN